MRRRETWRDGHGRHGQASWDQSQIIYQLSPRWLAIAAAVAIGGLVADYAPLVLCGTMVGLALGFSFLSGRYALAGVEFNHHLSAEMVSWGEELVLTVTITNSKALPLLWLEVGDDLPPGLDPPLGSLAATGERGRRLLPMLVALGPYQRLTRRYRLYARQRGDHLIGPLRVRAGDPFGLAVCTRLLPPRLRLVVYPRVMPALWSGPAGRWPIGDMRHLASLAADPTRLRAIRPYIQGDSIRQVHWKATARRGALQVKQLEPSATLQALLCLNLTAPSVAPDHLREDLFELATNTAASIAAHLAQRDVGVGLLINTRPTGSRPWTRLPVGRAARHLQVVLTTLAGLTVDASSPFTEMLLAQRRRISEGTTLLILTMVLSDDLLAVLRSYQATGYAVRLVMVGGHLRHLRPTGLVACWVGGESSWREHDLLQLEPGADVVGETTA